MAACASPRAPWLGAAVHRVVHREADPLGQRLEQRHLKVLALAGVFPLVERGQDAAERVHAAGYVGHRDAGLHLVGLGAGDRRDPRLALDEQVVGLLVAVGAVVPVTRHPAHDQPGMLGAQHVRCQAEAVGGTRREVLHEHVRAGQQFVEHLSVAGVLEVQRDGLLVAVEPDEVAGQAVDGGVVGAGEVAGARPLDLDHPGAEVGEVTGGQWHGHRLFQGEDGDSSQRQHGIGDPSGTGR
jgi:hypothetical protein